MLSLRVRVVLAIALLLLTGSVVGTALAGWRAKQVLSEELAAALGGGRQSAMSAFASLARSDDRGRDLDRLVESFDGNRHLRVTLADNTGRPLRASTPLPAQPAPAWFAALLQPHVAPLALTTPGGAERLVLAPVEANDVAALWSEFRDLVTVLSIALVFGAALVWLTVGQALRPLSDFSAAFLKIGSGDYSAKVREAGPSELVRLGRAVNDMARRLGAMQARTQRLEDQLRTLQDEERADLARDLHDEIGPHLFAVNVDAAMARRLIDEGRQDEATRQVAAIQQSVAHMQRLVRDILGRLRPTELIELGLKAAIDELIAFWQARHPAIAFEVTVPDDEVLALPEEAREAIYRVVQEALNNAVRHGRPGRVEIAVARLASGEVIARIADDGAPSGKPEGAGFGLRGMRERVAGAGGRLAISRRPDGGGWTVTARLAPASVGDELEEASAA
jgi:two-component system sensor histidine kinase UhpB